MAVHLLKTTEHTDINKLDPAGRTLHVDTLRRALADIVNLVADTEPSTPLSGPAQDPDDESGVF